MIEPIAQDAVDSWHLYLDRFDKEIYPKVFLSRKIDYNTALILWMGNDILSMLDSFKGDDDKDNEEWRQ